MNILEAIILGTIQGLTEWLPISSSGHLVLAQEWMGLSVPVAFDVMLHLSTALVIILMFRSDVKSIISSVFSPKPGGKKNNNNNYWRRALNDPYATMGWWIIIGSIPIAVLGLLFYNTFESFFSSVFIVGIALVGTAIVLFVSGSRYKTTSRKKMNALDAYSVGFAQALALIPGFSRSGFTISAGIMRGIERETAAKFSILLAVPAIIGAAVFEMPIMFSNGTGDIGPLALLAGTVTAFIVGYIAIKLLLLIVKKAGLHYFAFYCFALVIIIFISL